MDGTSEAGYRDRDLSLFLSYIFVQMLLALTVISRSRKIADLACGCVGVTAIEIEAGCRG